jgi:hypothetical protein
LFLCGLNQNLLDDLSVDIGEPEVPALKLIGQARVINAQAMQDRRLQIVNMDRILYDVVAMVIGLSNADAGFNSAASGPNRETARMMVTAVVRFRELPLTINSSPELPSPNNQGLIEQTALLEVLDQRGRSLVRPFALEGKITRQVVVLVPASMVKLNKTDSSF